MSDQKEDKKLVTTRTFEWVSAGIIGFISGLAQGAAEVRTTFHKKLLEYPELEIPLAEHAAELAKLKEQRLAGDISFKDFVTNTFLQKNKFSHEINDFAQEKLGFHSKDVRGLFQGTIERFRFMGTDTRIPIVFGAVFASTVGAAGTMMFFNSLHTREKLDEIASNVKPDQGKGR